MEWLSRWWKDLIRDVALTGFGLWVIYKQVFAAMPDPILIGAGLSLTFPSTYIRLREAGVIGPGPGLPSPPPGPEPSPASSSGPSGEG